jgi:hypothetical protein
LCAYEKSRLLQWSLVVVVMVDGGKKITSQNIFMPKRLLRCSSEKVGFAATQQRRRAFVLLLDRACCTEQKTYRVTRSVKKKAFVFHAGKGVPNTYQHSARQGTTDKKIRVMKR